MAATIEDIRRVLCELPTDERLAIANEILSENEDRSEFESVSSVEIHNRVNDVLDDTVELIPADQVFADARTKVAARWA